MSDTPKPKFDFKAQLELAYSSADGAAKRVEYMINATPTSDRRNKLTEANMHLMSAKAAIAEAEKL